jgi:hypothetical protein
MSEPVRPRPSIVSIASTTAGCTARSGLVPQAEFEEMFYDSRQETGIEG